MNANQKKVLVAFAVVFVAMLIYPPYEQAWGKVNWYGYSFIWDLDMREKVYLPTLLIQWVVAVVVGGVAFFLVKD